MTHFFTLKRIRIGFLGSLAAFLLLVFSDSLFPWIPTLGLDEHRGKTAPPDMHLLLTADAPSFSAALNGWVDDRAGLRGFLIGLKTEIDYSLFHTSRKVYLGSNRFLFERGGVNQLVEIERSDENRILQAEHAYQNFADLLAHRGIKLIIILHPDKGQLYPEYLPADAPNVPRPGKLEAFKDFFANMPGVMFIDVEKILSPLKGDEPPLYSRQDIHHRMQAALPVAKEIVTRVALAEHRPDIAWNEDFKFDIPTVAGIGSESRFLGLLVPLRELSVIPAHIYEVGKKERDGTWNIGASNSQNTGELGAKDLYDFEFHSNPELCASRLPDLVVYGNSFTDLYWTMGLHRYFCFIRRTRPSPYPEHIQAFVDQVPPGTKYFIYEMLTHQVLGNAPPPLK